MTTSLGPWAGNAILGPCPGQHSRNELTDPSLVIIRHSSRQLDIWLISGWHWAHLSHHGNSVRPCFRHGAASGPLLGRPLFTIFAVLPGNGLACSPVACPISVKIHHQCYRASLVQGSPLLAASLSVLLLLLLSLLSSSPFPACRPNQHIGSILQRSQRASQSSNARTRWATRPPCPPLHSLSQPRPKPPSHDQRLSRRPRQLWTF